MDTICQCELTGMVEILPKGKGCELCEGGQEITIESLKSALLFTKLQTEELNHKLKHELSTIVWRTDWENAPKGEKKFLILEQGGPFLGPVITTAYFYWYTEDDPGFKPVAYWCLQDAITDAPLDEDGPAELSSMKWALFPEGV
jgi:hypothetical protein